MNTSIDTLVKRFDTIKSNRFNWESHWQECSDFCLPQKAIITQSRAPGTKLKTDIYDCFDKETEILTKKGWKKFDEIQYVDKVLSLNPETGIAEYYPIEEIIIQDHNGKLKQFNSNAVTFSVTPNHKLLVKGETAKNGKFCKADDWKIQKISDIKIKRFYMKRDFIWKGKEQSKIKFKINKGSSKHYEFKMDDWLEFLGWFISEGFIFYNKKRKTYWVSICQSAKTNPDKCSEINKLFERMGLSNKQYTGMIYTFGSRAVAEHLIKYVGMGAENKRIPDYVKDLSPRQIRILLDSYRKGDGYKLPNGENRYNTCSKFLADDIQELILKTGSYARVSIRDNRGKKKFLKDHWVETKHLDYLIVEYIANRKSYDVTIHTEKIREISYEDKIYCVTVKPHHLIYVRKNGACFWSGNSTAIQSAQIFAAGLNSYLTNPSARWFALAMKSKALMSNAEVKEWLKECEDGIFDHLNGSNFNQVIHEDYIDFAVVGNSTLYEEEDPEDIITFAVRPISEIYFLADHRGRIDTVYRYFTYTARQAYQAWGENAGQKVLDLIKADKVEETVPFMHIVLPREERDVRKRDARNMPFGSLYVEPTTKKILSEGGYEEFPFFIGRCYKVSDSEYAYSPASMALADIKMLNQMSKTTLKGAQKAIDPPIVLPNDGYLLPFKTSAGAINYKLQDLPEERIEILDIKRDVGLGLEMENQRRTVVQRAFFVDLFLMLATLPEKNRTATEVMERVNERMLILGPMLGRLMHEKLDPIIIRTFNILMRNFKLPEPPAILEGQNYKIEYISPLAKAQKASEVKSITDLLIAVKTMAEVEPVVVDNLDLDKIAKRISEITYTSDLLRSDDEVKSIRQSRAEQQQMQMTLEQLKLGGEGAKNIMEAEGMMRGGGKNGGREPARKTA